MCSAGCRVLWKRRLLSSKNCDVERQLVTSRCIGDGSQGCHAKSHSWFNDEGVQLFDREHILPSGEKLTAQGIAKAVEEYLKSNQARDAVAEILGSEIAYSSWMNWLKYLLVTEYDLELYETG